MKNNSMKKALIVSGCCILAGVILLAVGMLVLGGIPGFSIDRTGIHSASDTMESMTQIMEKTKIDPFENIAIDVEYADVEVIPSDGYYVEYQLQEREQPKCDVEDGKLTFEDVEGVSVSFDFSFFSVREGLSRNDAVKVYVPKDAALKDVKIKTSSGDIDIKETLKLENLEIENEYGDISMDTIEAKSVDLKISSGDIHLIKADFHSLAAKSEYGDITIGIIRDMNDYEMDIATEYGTIKVPDQYYSDDDDEQSYETNGGTLGEFSVKCDSGDVTITNVK